MRTGPSPWAWTVGAPDRGCRRPDGWANPFSFVRAVRERFDGTIVLAGGISDGVALHAAQVLGADLGYMGTKFIATDESRADNDYRRALVEASLDDVVLSTR